MGLDLKVLPEHHSHGRFGVFSNDVISLNRCSTLFDIIQKLEESFGEKSQNGLYSYLYEEGQIGIIKQDREGNEIKAITAGQLKPFLVDHKPNGWKNKAFVAFVNEMPDNIKLWLYWH